MGVEFSFLIFWPMPRGVGASILAETAALKCSFVYMLLGFLTRPGSSISDIMSKILISTLLLFLLGAIRFYFSAKTGRRSLWGTTSRLIGGLGLREFGECFSGDWSGLLWCCFLMPGES